MAERAIVCIHGLWMKKVIFLFMLRSLRATGANVHLFQYSSIRTPFETSRQRLAAYVATIDAKQIDFVAHSLGGLLLFHYFSHTQDPRFRRVALMGTPLQGSATARACGQIPVLKSLLGRNRRRLEQGIEQWSAPGETIMIAGTRSLGVGRLFGPTLSRPNDGTVAVAETRHPKLSAHYQIPVSHSSMLYSRQAMRIIQTFLTARDDVCE